MLRHVRRCVGLLVLVVGLVGILGCADGDGDGGGGTLNPDIPASVNVQGTYRGTWTSTKFVGTGTVTVQIAQATGGSTITGTVTFGGSPCFTRGVLSGVVSGFELDGAVDFGAGIQIQIAANIAQNGTSLTGNYAVNTNSTRCSTDEGRFTAVR